MRLWALPLITWLMNSATQLANWMLPSPDLGSWVGSRVLTVRVLSRNGSIVRTSRDGTISQWPPLVHQLTNTGKRSTTWFLLQSINETLDSPGLTGEENGEAMQMWFTLSFQEPARGPRSEERRSSRN